MNCVFRYICALSLLVYVAHGQCGSCSDCDALAADCGADPDCRVLTDGAINTGDPATQICVDIGTCDSDCAMCSNTECASSRANCFISGSTSMCVGDDCQLSCLECTAGDGSDCNTSEAEPNGCVFDSGAAEACTPADTDSPTTAAPTTASPTTAAPTTAAPTTATPTTAAPTTASPTTSAPTTASPTTAAPTTAAPTTAAPTTPAPTTLLPTTTTASPTTTLLPTTLPPTTPAPTTAAPTTASPTTATPTTALPTTSMPTAVDDCPECPIEIGLTSIGNITIGPCPTEVDCECDNGFTSISFVYVNGDDATAGEIAFTTSADPSIELCPAATGVPAGEEIVCTIDPLLSSGLTIFPALTRYAIYDAGANLVCEGTFDTSCSDDILGDVGSDDCPLLVVSSWTDADGGVCTGNVSLDVSTSLSDSTSSSSSSDAAAAAVWVWRDIHSGDSSSSGSRRRRRRMLLSSSDSLDSSDDSWYENKKCIPNCAQWGAQRGLTCGCYESCTASALNSSCYEGNSAGYCGTGVCCCGGECLAADSCDYGFGSSSSDSDSSRRRTLLASERCYSDSGSSSAVLGGRRRRRLMSSSASASESSAYYSYDEYYADRCGLVVEADEDDGSSSSDGLGLSLSVSSSSGRRRRRRVRRRRRALLGGPFGSRRKLLSSSVSASASASAESSSTSGLYNDYLDEFLVETCLTYSVAINVSDACPDIEIVEIFLPLCENNFTDFNSSVLDADDLTSLITNDSFASGSNVASAVGAERDGVLGILVTLEDDAQPSFELCLGNVTVSAENLDTLNVTTIDVSSGLAVIDDDGDRNSTTECPVDGLPCFNFFFEAECPTTTTTSAATATAAVDDGTSVALPGVAALEIARDCDCRLAQTTAFSLTYTGDDVATVTVTVTRKLRSGDVYGTFTVSTGDTFVVEASGAGYDAFQASSGLSMVDAITGEALCTNRRLRASNPGIVGEELDECEDILVNSFTCSDGAVCDAIAVQLYDDDVSADSALLNGGHFASDNPFVVFAGLDPYIRYTLIGLMVTFVGLVLVACYFCVIARNLGKQDDDDFDDGDHDTRTKMVEMHHISQLTRGNNDDDDDDDDEEAKPKKGKLRMQRVRTNDDDDLDDADEFFDGDDIDIQPAIVERGGDESDEFYEEDAYAE